MNTIAMHHATAVATGSGLRRQIVAADCLSVHSPVYVLHEPPSP